VELFARVLTAGLTLIYGNSNVDGNTYICFFIWVDAARVRLILFWIWDL